MRFQVEQNIQDDEVQNEMSMGPDNHGLKGFKLFLFHHNFHYEIIASTSVLKDMKDIATINERYILQ